MEEPESLEEKARKLQAQQTVIRLKPGDRLLGEAKTGISSTVTVLYKPPEGIHTRSLFILKSWRWVAGVRLPGPAILLPAGSLPEIAVLISKALDIALAEGDGERKRADAGPDALPAWATPFPATAGGRR